MKKSVTGLSWEEYRTLEVGERAKYLTREGRIFDVLFSQQFDRAFLDDLYTLTNKIRLIAKTHEGGQWLGKILSTHKVMFYFVQPSTRTFLSFQTACQTLGMRPSDVRSLETSSEVKGESFEDTIRTFSSYFDLIIMRHPKAGYAERASFVLNDTKRPVPLINAGSGKDQHPTQALLDIFTLRKSFNHQGDLEGKTILMSGDLKRGRTVRSLCYLLSNFKDVKVIFSSPQEFAMEEDIKAFLRRKNIEFEETFEFKSSLPKADAIYMTRLQDEHDEKGKKSSIDCEEFSIKGKDLTLLKPSAIIMHPLPRRDEIHVDVDKDPRAIYWRQVRNGMWTRAALISYIFGVSNKILDR